MLLITSYIIYFDEDYEEELYEEIISIYNTGFYSTINGKRPKRSMKINWDGTPSEYIAYTYDFFDSFNKEGLTIQKYKLREEIILASQTIIQELKEIINRIVDKYEKEIL